MWSVAIFFFKIMSKGILALEIFLDYLTNKLITKHGICVLCYSVRLTNDMFTASLGLNAAAADMCIGGIELL
jgi:hypothetical protein